MESNNKKLEAMKNFENRIKRKKNSYSINTGLSKLDKLIGNLRKKSHYFGRENKYWKKRI